MTEPQHSPDSTPARDRTQPPPGSGRLADHEPTTEAERQVTETVHSISRLEESN